jgi:hypothetical protein
VAGVLTIARLGYGAIYAEGLLMQYMNLRPSQVILDPENPRLPDGTSDDREAINRLIDEGLVGLARDIARTGQTNPAELPIAVKEGSKYLVLEGNRRFAALKLLKDPDLAYEDEQQKAFRRAALLGTPPKTVYALVLSSREEADHWIVLRHTGENNGVGIKRWSASQTATHRRRANKSIDSGTLRSIVIADQLEEAYANDEQIVTLVRRLRREKLTNIGRFFSPDVLDRLQFTLSIDNNSSLQTRTLLVHHSAQQLRDFFVWALTYILDNSVDAYKNRAIRQNALTSAANVLPPIADSSAEPFRLVDGPALAENESAQQPTEEDPASGARDDGGESSSTRGGSTDQNSSSEQGRASTETPSGSDSDEQAARTRKRDARPERYILQDLKLPNQPQRVQQLLRECRSLNLEEFPGIACVMMRVMVELSVSSPDALALTSESETSTLRNKIIAALKVLDPDIDDSRKRDRELAQAYIEASELGVQYLNGFVHNPAVRPDQHLARRFSSAFRPLLARLDEKL